MSCVPLGRVFVRTRRKNYGGEIPWDAVNLSQCYTSQLGIIYSYNRLTAVLRLREAVSDLVCIMEQNSLTFIFVGAVL